MRLLYDSHAGALSEEAFLRKAACAFSATSRPRQKVRQSAARGKRVTDAAEECPRLTAFGVQCAQGVVDDLFQRDVLSGSPQEMADLFLREV